MGFTFELPRNNKQLLNDANGSNYFVKQIYNAREIPARLLDARRAIESKNPFFIFDHFDIFFSVIENAMQLHIKQLMRTIETLYRTTEHLGRMLDAYLKQDTQNRHHEFLNLIKMVLYLLVSTVRVIDKFISNNFQQTKIDKKNTNDEQSSYLFSYNSIRYDVLVQVCNIMQLPIEKLWNMSIVDENFINLLCDLAYRSLLHPSTKEKRVTDIIFHILGTAIKHHRHGMAFPIQIVEIMDREETAVIPIARGIRCLNDDFGIKSIMSNLLKELIDKVNLNPSSQIASKNVSLFIMEIANISPELSLQCLEMSEDLLNLEPYGVRNSLFTMINIMIVNHLVGEDLNDDQKTLRDELLEDLWNHMNDINSFVRSKVILVWNDLKKRNAVPVVWILPVVTRAIERLEDRTATVRKNAVILLRSFLESNPFSSKLQLDIIEQKLMEETEKMRIIRGNAREQFLNQENIIAEFNTRCFPKLIQIFPNILNDEQQLATLSTACSIIANTESSERVQKIRGYLRDGNFEDAARYVIQVDALVGHQSAWKALTVDGQMLYFVSLLRTYLLDDFESEIGEQSQIVEFFGDTLAFSKAMAGAVPKVENLLFSTTTTDVFEAVEFFKTGYMFDIKGTEAGMRKMLRLLYICSGQEKNEKGEAVIRAYQTVFFQTDATERAHHVKVVDNLYNFLKNITMDEYHAFELMVKHWMLSDLINIHTINVLFERFTLKLPDTSNDYARCCLELLNLVANTKPIVAQSNKKLIIDILNSRRVLEDPRIFAGCLKLLVITIQPTDANGNKVTTYTGGNTNRFENIEVINGIISTFKKFFFYPKLPDFELVATQSIDFLYKMCQAPDLLGQEIIRDICKKLNEISQKRIEKSMDTASGTGLSQVTELFIPKYLLPRIIFIFGYIASKELVFLDNDVYLNVKYREELHSKNKNSILDGSVNRTSNTSATSAQEQVYLGASAEDSLADMITTICEKELIGSDDGLLYHFVPILIEILSHPVKYSDPYVQRAAVLTLLRFMVVSSSFCSDRIAFLMNILKKTKDSQIKCNIIIGLSDLIGRFANTIEPWIPNFYTMLIETDVSVRLTTIKMLSYMILQGIIRATGQLSDVATCIVDDVSEIQNTTQEFFRQLIMSKELDFYKVLPDIVSRLSSNESPIAEDKFHKIMRFLLELISKDRQVESFVEKLLSRFRNTNAERQWRDIAFCLSLLNHSEKTMKKLLDHLPNYKDKIQCEDIYDYFKVIVSNANKQMLKPELKKLTKEFEIKLQNCLEYGANANVSIDGCLNGADASLVDNTNTLTNVKNSGQGKTNKKLTKLKKNPRKLSDSDEENCDFEDTVVKRQTRKRK